MQSLKNINFRQPKYVLPAVAYPFLLILGYILSSLFTTKIERSDHGVGETTDYLNAHLPDANIKGDGIGSKHENMRQTFGNILDLSAISNLDAEDSQTEEFESRYTAEDLMYMLEQQRLLDEQTMRDSIRRVLEAEMGVSHPSSLQSDEPSQLDVNAERVAQVQAEIDSALAVLHAQAERDARLREDSVRIMTEVSTTSPVTGLADTDEAKTVVKKGRLSSEYFNTVGLSSSGNSLIKAIVDEDITVSDGSRIRLRLLDDVEIEGAAVPRNTYLYAEVGGFGSQRVTGSVNSILLGDRLVRVSLSIYDTDGLEGLYVPQSEFRQTGKDVAASALQSGNMMVSGGYGSNSLTQMAVQSLQNAYQQTTSAISKAIRKNKTKLKYGTYVYLINSKDNK